MEECLLSVCLSGINFNIHKYLYSAVFCCTMFPLWAGNGRGHGSAIVLLIATMSLMDLTHHSCSADSNNYRLPKSVKPVHYDLHIITNLEENDFSFQGKVFIKVLIQENTDTIELHAANLSIPEKGVVLRSWHKNNNNNINNSAKKQDQVPIISMKHLDQQHFFRITAQRKLNTGEEYMIEIPFSGKLTADLRGYYRSSYKDRKTNQTKWLAVTQFESTDARRAFPCFDEPEFKAIFRLNLAHKKELKSTSNMPIKETVPMEGKVGWVWDKYPDSLPMSTYLVAYIVSEFDCKEAPKSNNHVNFRICARKDAMDQVDFALENGPKFLSFYESFFRIKYPLPKQDLVAIPDFNAGAMENWGMITFREIEVLSTANSSIQTKHKVGITVAHELAHQWFGNLVTMKWWTDLWLNEGFATYMEEVSLDHVHPEWNIMKSDMMSNIIQVMEFDKLKSSHPISVEIHDPKEVDQVFDVISYQKGSLMIRMIRLLFGDDVFTNGLHDYLTVHQYSNAEQNDLWVAWTKAAHKGGKLDEGLTIKEIMDSWTLQTGYPLVTVTRHYDTGKVILEQKHYQAMTSSGGKDNDNHRCWWIPLTYTTKKEHDFNNTTVKKWLNCKGPVEIHNVGSSTNDWIIFNIKITGLYRVNYDNANWQSLAETLNSKDFKTIAVMNRAQLVHDSMDLAKEGVLDYKVAIKIFNYLEKEDEFVPWQTGLNVMGQITSLLKRTPIFSLLKSFMKKKLLPLYNKFKNLEEIPKTFDDQRLKKFAIAWGSDMEVEDCIPNTLRLFNKWKSQHASVTTNPIPEDIREIVYCNAVGYGGEEAWSFMWEKYQTSNVASEQLNILRSLGCSKDVSLLNRYLMMSIDGGSGIRSQDSLYVFSSVAKHPIGYYVAAAFLYKNIDEIYKLYGSHPNQNLGHYITSLSYYMVDKGDLHTLSKFCEKHKHMFSGATMIIKQSKDRIGVNINWMKRNYYKVLDIFSSIPKNTKLIQTPKKAKASKPQKKQ